MRSIIEFTNYPHKDGTVTNIKFYLEDDKIVKYEALNLAPFCGHMAILSKEVNQVTLNELLRLAIQEINNKNNEDFTYTDLKYFTDKYPCTTHHMSLNIPCGERTILNVQYK